jgi:SAM-dependent methyltransferase
MTGHVGDTLSVLARRSGDAFLAPIYFRGAERRMGRQWAHYIWPRIHDADFTTVIEVGCGHGRNTARLAPLAQRLIAVDINAACVAAARRRLAGQANVRVLQNDGTSLGGIPSGSATLVYCWDAMVHFEPEVVAAYVSEVARVLAPGGRGFVHHSNWTQGQGRDFRSQPHWRNVMSKDRFAALVQANGLAMIRQDVIDWDTSHPWWKTFGGLRRSHRPVPGLDCITQFRRPTP